MYLQQILNGIAYEIVGNGDPDVTSLSCDTSTVKQGSLFFCLKGNKCDGHNFFRKAIGDGACAVVTERKLDTKALQIIVSDTRQAMSLCAKNFYDGVCDKLKIITVVGTNGKTSTTYLLDAVFSKAGYKTGVIGTNGVFFDGKKHVNNLTTPDPITLHYWLYQMYLNQVRIVIMEVSAHAIDLKKMYGIVADTAVFTNFSQDHLDYFRTMENYKKVKKSYFCKTYCNNAVINADDVVGREIMDETNVPFVAYGLTNGSVIATNVETNPVSFTLNLFDEVGLVNANLFGMFNVYNMLAASAVGALYGIGIDVIVSALQEVTTIEGRNEIIMLSDNVRVVIDFAHTPDGLHNILTYLKSTTEGKLIVVFGCGGNRDKYKRPLMAEEVSKFADYAVLTNDNPRFEEPSSIAQDVERGLSCEYRIVLNRSQATEFAMSIAKCGDTIAILGKGSETYQEIKGRKYPYSDVETVLKLCRANTY